MPFSRLYGKFTALRNRFYDRGVFRSHPLGARTISIGNLTTGGTGKTPLVAYIAAVLAARGEIVCILTRGYGRRDPRRRVVVSDGENVVRDPAVAGDEPIELALKLRSKAIIIADADRVAAAQWAREQFGVTSFLLDDGFQHRKAKRDVDIVCIDATDPWGGGKTLPGGRLREPAEGISRADTVVITRAELSEKVEQLRSEILKMNSKISVFTASTKIVRVTDLSEFLAKAKESEPLDGARSQTSILGAIRAGQPELQDREVRVSAFCGLGNPQSFFGQVQNNQDLVVSMLRSFADHHKYTQHDIASLEKQAKQDGSVDALVTTVKDAVKLRDLQFTIPCFVVEVELYLDRPQEFAALL